VANRDVAGSKIDDGGRNKERRNLARAALDQLPVLALDDVENADAGRNVNADFIQVRIFLLPVRRLHGKVRGGQRYLDEAAHLLEFFFFDPPEGVEIFDSTCDFAIEAVGIVMSVQPDAAMSGDEGFVRLLCDDYVRED